MADYTAPLTLARDPAALMDELNLVLAAGRLSPASSGLIGAAVQSIDPDRGDGMLNQVRTAVLLVKASPEYLVVK